MANQNIQYDVDVSAVQRLLTDLKMERKDARRAIRLGLSQSGRVIRNEARKNLLRAYCRSGKIEADPMIRFVRSGVFKDLSGVLISIAGNHKHRYVQKLASKGIRDLAFTLKFFENGTQYRYNTQKRTSRSIKKKLKCPRYTGYIVASHFFSDAVASKTGEAQRLLQQFIVKHILRIAKKNQSR